MNNTKSPSRDFLEAAKLAPANRELLKDTKELEAVLQQMRDQNFRPELIHKRREDGMEAIKLRHAQRVAQDTEKLKTEREKLIAKIEAERRRDPQKSLLEIELSRLRFQAMSKAELAQVATDFEKDKLDLDPDSVRELSRVLKDADPELHTSFRHHVAMKNAEAWHLRTEEGREIEKKLDFLTRPGDGKFSVPAPEDPDEWNFGTVCKIEELISNM